MNRLLCVICLLAVSGPGLAIKPTGTAPATPNVAPPKPADLQSAKSDRDDSSGLRKGTIEAVSTGGGTFQVYGQRLTFNAKQVKVFGRDGRPSNIYALRTGVRVRFALDPADPLRRRVALIYVD